MRCAPFIALLMILMGAASSVAGEGEYQVKAAMLLNFAKLVEWPADSFGGDNRITFCIAGKSPIIGPIQKMQGKPVKGRTVSIRQVARTDDVAGCQLLFIPQSEHAHLSSYLQQANHLSVLTVSDLERFASSGGMIGFYEEDSNVRFEINLETIQKRRLQLSSYLLNLARRVR
jgi:hypothetical protein